MQYSGVQLSFKESKQQLDVTKVDDPVQIFNSVSQKVKSLIIAQGFGELSDRRDINDISGNMTLRGDSRQLNRNLTRWAKFVEIIEKHPLIKVLEPSEEEENRDPRTRLIIHAWQKEITCELSAVSALLDCEALQAMTAQTEVTLPRLDISHLAWNAINKVGDLLRNQIERMKDAEYQERQRNLERQRQAQQRALEQQRQRKAAEENSCFSKIFCCLSRRSNYETLN